MVRSQETLPPGYFVTGTDTDAGKTRVALGLMSLLQKQGYNVAGMKPVASGCVMTESGLRNDDARLLQSQASKHADYDLVNPYAFAPPIAPHIAAERAGIAISIEHIQLTMDQLRVGFDCVVVEGVGGWRVPLNEGETIADLARILQMPVIMVVGLRLGCINHAILCAETIVSDGSQLCGWVATQVDRNYDDPQATVETLIRKLQVPMLGLVPWLDRPEATVVADYLGLANIVPED